MNNNNKVKEIRHFTLLDGESEAASRISDPAVRRK